MNYAIKGTMTSIFQFKVSDDLRTYKENQIYVDVSLLGNNINYYLRELDSFNVSMKKDEIVFFRKVDTLNLGRNHKKIQLLEETSLDVLSDLKRIGGLCSELFPEHKIGLTDRINSINIFFENNKETFYFGCMELIEPLYNDILNLLERKITMCQKLKQMENRTLKAIVTFFKDGYETHFTKYHLNLEEFSEQLHTVLRDELDTKFIAKYKELEEKHFSLMEEKEANNTITLKTFLEFSDGIMQNLSEIKNFPEKLLKAQPNMISLNIDVEGLMSILSRIENKFDAIYTWIKANHDAQIEVSELYLKSISVLYNYKLIDFINFDSSKAISFFEEIKFKKFINEKITYLSIGNLIRTEPEIGIQLVVNAIAELQKKGDFEMHSKNEKFMLKKAKRHFFDNNQYYTHEIMFYEIFPREVEFKKNKFIRSNSYDKVYMGENIHRVTSDVYSHLLKKIIKYEFYLKTVSYYVNPYNKPL